MGRFPLCGTSSVTRRKHPGSPDSSGLARKLSRCKEGMPCPDERSETGARVFAVMVQILLSITRVAGNKLPILTVLGTAEMLRY
jgi:hypothetical protein